MEEENKRIILERQAPTDFIVNFGSKRYVWAGRKGKAISRKEIDHDTYEFLSMNTSTLKDGELIISDKNTTEFKNELIEELNDKDDYKVNALTREEVEKMLKGNLATMNSGFSKITSNTTKRFVYEVAKEIGVSNANKQKAIKELIGSELSIEDLFPMNEE